MEATAYDAEFRVSVIFVSSPSTNNHKRDENFDNRSIPSRVLKIALSEVLDILGQDTKQQMLKDLKASRVDLDDESVSYSVYHIRMYFHSVFEEEAAELLTDILRKTLVKIE